nr:flagellar hook-associated protein FlgK [Salinicola salarius]
MSLFSIGLSGLSAAQNALSTTSNNISNVYTDGYSRQLTLLGQNSSGEGGGSGVSVDGIQRQYNSYISSQLNQVNSRESALETYQSQVNQIDDLLADSDSGLTTLMQNFFSSLEDLTGAPSDAAAREGVLGSARSMVAQFRAYDGYLSDMREGINGQIGDVVTQVNDLSDQIADLNKQVTLARARSGEEPNALLDQRDKLVSDLGELVDVNVQVQDGSTYQVSLSNGTPLVAGKMSFDLVAVKSDEDPSNITIAYEDGAGSRSPLKESVIQGGELGGLMSFRSETLDSVQNQIGQLAVSLATAFNEQHQAGFDSFAQSHLVSEQDARRKALTHFMSYIELMLNDIDARAHETFERMTGQCRLHTQDILAQIIPVTTLNTASQQALKGLSERNIRRQARLHNRFNLHPLLIIFDAVLKYAHHLIDAGNGIVITLLISDAITDFEYHARERSRVFGIDARLFALRKQDVHAAIIDVDHHT